MKKVKKTIASGIFLAIVFALGGACVFVLSSAQAAEMSVSDMSLVSVSGNDTASAHCPKKNDDGCGMVHSQKEISDCTLLCSGSASKTVAAKKTQDTQGILLSIAFLEFVPRETGVSRFAPGALARNRSPKDILLTVSKKE